MDDLEKQLAALKAERTTKQAARDELKKEAKLKAEIAKIKQAMLDDEVFETCQLESAEPVGRINTPHGMVVVKAPIGLIYARLQDEMMRSDHVNIKVRTSAAAAAEKAAKECVVYPDRAAYTVLADKVATLPSVVLNMALELGKAEAVEEAGK